MADANYEPSAAGWAAIALSPDILDACLSEARRGEGFAESISPVETGEYKRSFHVVPTTVRFRRGPRVAAVLYNDAPYAAAVEWQGRWRGRGGRPHAVVRRTAAFLGGLG